MGQTATRHVAEDQATTAPAGAAAAATALSPTSPLRPPVAPISLLEPGTPEIDETSTACATPAAAGDEQTGDMAASSPCKVSFRQSLAKMRWTASSLEALRAAEDKLLVSAPVTLVVVVLCCAVVLKLTLGEGVRAWVHVFVVVVVGLCSVTLLCSKSRYVRSRTAYSCTDASYIRTRYGYCCIGRLVQGGPVPAHQYPGSYYRWLRSGWDEVWVGSACGVGAGSVKASACPIIRRVYTNS